jgi:hypothetical protein
MLYERPEHGNYSDNMTAQSMTDGLTALILERNPGTSIEKLVYQDSVDWVIKLWDNDQVKDELGEYLFSFLTGDLDLPVPGIEGIFEKDRSGNTRINGQKLDCYIKLLGKHYGHKAEAVNDAVSRAFEEIKSRIGRVYEEIRNIADPKDDDTMKRIARDAYGHIAMFTYSMVELYISRIELDMEAAHKKHQS